MHHLPEPPKEAIIYEDERLYVCLASFPLTKGHAIVAWKDEVPDIHLLSRADYEYLMWHVEQARDALLKALNLEKVYLLYMDEIRHVHWHLVPRYNERGYNVLTHKPKELRDFKLAREVRLQWPIMPQPA